MSLLELIESNAVPIDQICSQEFIENVYRAGSLISVIENKKLNFTNLFVLLLEKPEYRDLFVEITSSNSFRESLFMMMKLNPSLAKSKIVKSVVKKINARSNN